MELNLNELELQIQLQLPDNFEKYDKNIQTLIVQYLSQLDSIDKKAYKIAKEHLGSSFNIVKSNGFCDWKKLLKK
jgi:hypothetical protein